MFRFSLNVAELAIQMRNNVKAVDVFPPFYVPVHDKHLQDTSYVRKTALQTDWISSLFFNNTSLDVLQ